MSTLLLPSREPQTYLPEVTRPTPVVMMNNSRLSHMDSSHNNGRSPSGHLVPCSPTTARHHSQIPWVAGSQTSFHDEPGSINRHLPKTESLLQTSSSATVCTHHDNLPSSSDVHAHQLHPNHIPETSSRNHGVNLPTQSAHINIDTSRLEHDWGTPLHSMKSSSQLSVSQKSYNSRSSIGRASYREHRGPPARDHTPTPEYVTTRGLPSSFTTGMAMPSGGFAVPEPIIALPSADDPNRPEEPVENIGNRFYPMPVNAAIRYENRNTRSLCENDCMVKAMSYQYPKTPSDVPEGWTACRHPEGALYFVHDKTNTFTEVNICDRDIYRDIEYFRTFLFKELITEITRGPSVSLNIDEVELVLEPKKDKLGFMCCYYFVNPQARSVFWLDDWEPSEVFRGCKGAFSTAHKGLAIEAQYWCATYIVTCDVLMIYGNCRNHWDLFPNSREVTQELKDEVVDMILHATCDHLTSDTSTCPLSVNELEKHLAVVNQIDPKNTGKRGHRAVIIGRIMHTFYNAYFMNYYGEDCARLNFDQTVHGWRYSPSLLITIVAPLLFMVPISELRLLHRIYVDNTASKERWNTFRIRLNSQFQAISVLATVLLNANVALLPKQSGTGTSLQQYLGYMSLVTCMASIILGLAFLGKTRLEERASASSVANFLNNLWHKKHGLETLAIAYSLPYAFLMWGMILFLAAFVAQWLSPGDIISRSCAGAFMLFVALLVAWSIWTAQDESNPWWFLRDPGYPGQEKEEEDSENGRKVYFRKPWLGFVHRFETPLFRRWAMSHDTQSHPRESHHMQNTGSSRELVGQNHATAPNAWVASPVP